MKTKKFIIFSHILLLEQNISKKMQINKNITELNTSDNKSKKYKIKTICDNKIYAKKLADHLLKLYYLVL